MTFEIQIMGFLIMAHLSYLHKENQQGLFFLILLFIVMIVDIILRF